MCKFIIPPLIFCSVLIALTNCTSSFDQRQTGALNVQIGLKNIHLIALLKGGNEEYVDYDYVYDYSEMTIKPQKTTTIKPLNITTTHSVNVTDALISATAIATDHTAITTESYTNATGSSQNSNIESVVVLMNQTAANLESTSMESLYTNATTVAALEDTTIMPNSPNSTSATPTTATSKCRRGFVLNSQGKCEYKVHGTSNALRRIVTLAQKIKIGRGYKGT